MAYQTGTALEVNDLLDKLRVFCAANGWTNDSNTTEGTGNRWHAHRGTVYINFRSFINETVSSDVSLPAGMSAAGVYGVAFNVGTGYSGASAWYNQAGVPQGTASKYMTAGIRQATGAISSYHFFAHNSGDNIIAVIEYASGFYQFFGFGTLAKYGAFTGGEYFFGSSTGASNYVFTSQAPSCGFIQAKGGDGQATVAFVNATVDAEAGWKFSTGVVTNAPTGVRKVLDNNVRFDDSIAIQPNTLNDLAVFMPVKVHCYRDTSNNVSSSFRSPIGEIPKVHRVSIYNLLPGQQATLGATDYRVFPFWKKNAASVAPDRATQHSAVYGFAVEE